MITRFGFPPDGENAYKLPEIKRCGNVIGCNLPIDFSEYHINLEERTFCCQDCLQSYLETERRLEYTAEAFKLEGERPLNYEAKEKWRS